jgi:hypothetical protein
MHVSGFENADTSALPAATNTGGSDLGLFALFRRPPPIRDLGELASFIDAQAAFVTQKGIYEYARARAGHYAKVLFREPMFVEAVERSRWSAYPIGLALVAELVEGILRPRGDAERWQAVAVLSEMTLSVFDRYPVPPQLGEPVWAEARAELARRLKLIGLHPVKFAKDIPEPYAQVYFDLLPIHEKLRGRDFPTTRNYLRVTMIQIHDEFTKRADAPALTDALRQEFEQSAR